MCEYTFGTRNKVPSGLEGIPPLYEHFWIEGGCIIITQRTIRVSPAGWAFAVVLNGSTHFLGYAETQKKALQMGAHMLSGQCGYEPRHRAERGGEHGLPEPVPGRHRSARQLPRWAA